MVECETGLPLVTVVVITYNSAKFVLETLNSIRSQTYAPLELVITDDCSKDATVDICRKWIADNNSRFSRAELITVGKNTGISANCNRGLDAAGGEWVKIIAGDDILEDDCVAENIRFVLSDPDIQCVSCQITVFSDDVCKCNQVDLRDDLFELPQKKQLRYLLTKGNFIVGASVFFNAQLVREMGGCNERYPMLDDYPLIIKIYQAGKRFYLLKKPLVRYRVHGCNVSLNPNSLFSVSLWKFYDEVIPGLLLEQGMFLHYWHAKVIAFKRRFPENGNVFRKLVRAGLSMLSPVSYVMALEQLFDAT